MNLEFGLHPSWSTLFANTVNRQYACVSNNPATPTRVSWNIALT